MQSTETHPDLIESPLQIDRLAAGDLLLGLGYDRGLVGSIFLILEMGNSHGISPPVGRPGDRWARVKVLTETGYVRWIVIFNDDPWCLLKSSESQLSHRQQVAE